MKTLRIAKDNSTKTVGDIIDAMYKSGEFGSVSIIQLTDMIHAFLKEYVGMPGSIVTKKFTKDAAEEFSVRFGASMKDVVKIISVFRLKSGGSGSGVKSKLMRAYGKVTMKGGVRSGVKSRM